MKLSKQTRTAVLGLALVLLVIGVVQLVGNLRAQPTTRVLAAATDLAVGARLTESNTSWVELPAQLASEYASGAETLGLAVALPVRAHEFIVRRALKSEATASQATGRDSVLVTLQPASLPVAPLRAGDLVDVWVSLPAAGSGGAAAVATTVPMLAAPAAIISAVSADATGFGAAARTVDLLIASADLPGVLAATMAQRPEVVLVRSATLASAGRLGGGK